MTRERERERTVSPETRAAIGALPLPVDWSRVRLYRQGCGRGAGLRAAAGALAQPGPGRRARQPCLPARALRRRPGAHGPRGDPLRPVSVVGAVALLHSRRRGADPRSRPSPLRVRRQSVCLSPVAGTRPFDAYGMEQQAQIVEDALRGSAVAAGNHREVAPRAYTGLSCAVGLADRFPGAHRASDPPTARECFRRGRRPSP